MLERLLKRVVLVVVMATVALTAFEVQAQFSVESGKIIYYDPYMRIEISGTWASASGAGNVVTVVNPSGAYFRVKLVSADGYEEVERETITTYQNGYIKFKVESESIDEDSHTVELYVEIEADIDLDCDADWDGDIDEDDDPIEESIGGLVGLHKTAPLKLSFGSEKFYPADGQLSFSVQGGIVLCKDREGTKVIAENPYSGQTVWVAVAATDIQGTYYVKGVSPSENFNDCKVIATYTLPSGASAEDTVGFTVVTVDITIDGQSEVEEEREGAYALFVDDFGESPYAPRATNYLKRVEMRINPRDFPEDRETNIWIDVTGSLDHLFEKIPMAATWGKAQYSPATNRYTLADLKKQDSAEGGPYFALHGHNKSMKKLRDHSLQIKEPKTTVEDTGLFTVVKLNVVPDYDRDHIIGDKDEKQLCMDKKFYWWINDDYDNGDSANIFSDEGTDIHGGFESLRNEIKERNARNRASWVDSGGSVGSAPEEETEPQKQNCDDDVVNGRRDLLDFFPMWVDAYDALKLFEGVDGIGLRLDFPGLGIVDTDLEKNDAGQFLYESHSTADGKVSLHEAYVDNFGTTTFTEERKIGFMRSRTMEAFLELINGNSDKGILMVEGCGGGNVILYLTKRNEETGEIEDVVFATTPMSTRDVRDFYSEVSLYKEEPEIKRERKPELDELFDEKKDVISLHGFKVSDVKADGWHSEFFKRLYQSQSYARFWGVTWDGAYDDGKWYHSAGQFYHRDAAHAFVTAKRLKAFLDDSRGQTMKGEVSVMAHSLGNMVVSAAIALENMEVNRYFMLDAAVAAEAYDGECDDARMINHQWKDYPKKSFCSKWYKLFEGAPDVEENGKKVRDARQDLKWPSLFPKKNCTVYNYYSSEDEVFELRQDVEMDDKVKPLAGFDASQYSWQKQEIGKGADMWLNVLIDESEALGISDVSGGWGFHKPKFWRWWPIIEDFLAVYSAAQARAASDDKLMQNPVFAHTPEKAYEWEKYDNEYTRTQKLGLLCHVVPAMSESAGHVGLGKPVIDRALQAMKNGWGRDVLHYGTRWLHCDLKDMAYYFNFNAWENIVADGNFMKENGQ